MTLIRRDLVGRWLASAVTGAAGLGAIGCPGQAAAAIPGPSESAIEAGADARTVPGAVEVRSVALRRRTLVVRVRWDPGLMSRSGRRHAFNVTVGVGNRVFAAKRDFDRTPDPVHATYRLEVGKRAARQLRSAANRPNRNGWVTVSQQYDAPTDRDRLFEINDVSGFKLGRSGATRTSAGVGVTEFAVTEKSAVDLGPGSQVVGQDLRGADLRRAKLTGATFDGANLSGANLSNAELDRAVLSDSQLDGAHLVEVRLGGAEFRNCKMRETHFQFSVLPQTKFSDSDMKSARFSNSEFSDVLVTRSDLLRADMSASTFESVLISHSDLKGVDFELARFRNTRLTAVSLGFNRVREAAVAVQRADGRWDWISLGNVRKLVHP